MRDIQSPRSYQQHMTCTCAAQCASHIHACVVIYAEALRRRAGRGAGADTPSAWHFDGCWHLAWSCADLCATMSSGWKLGQAPSRYAAGQVGCNRRAARQWCQKWRQARSSAVRCSCHSYLALYVTMQGGDRRSQISQSHNTSHACALHRPNNQHGRLDASAALHSNQVIYMCPLRMRCVARGAPEQSASKHATLDRHPAPSCTEA